MAEINQFGSVKPTRSGEGTSCAECELMLTDAIDGTLRQQAAFDLHIATCSECSQMLADAKRGAALLEMLKSPRPEPSASLLERILAQTSGPVAASSIQPAPSPMLHVVPMPVSVSGVAAPVATNILAFPSNATRKFSLASITHTMMQPRLAMTAAMAFFSIALTMNLTGVHLTELKASDLTPSNLKRSFYQVQASSVRYYDNLRVVYELESRVHDLQHADDSDNPPVSGGSGIKTDSKPNSGTDPGKPQEQKPPQKTPKSGSGTSQRRTPFDQEFKLATSRRPSSASRDLQTAALLETAFLRPTDKLKKELQEGGSV